MSLSVPSDGKGNLPTVQYSPPFSRISVSGLSLVNINNLVEGRGLEIMFFGHPSQAICPKLFPEFLLLGVLKVQDFLRNSESIGR